tara:strand:+ start:340 stop:855 length:516 start_codon:yes stop_codon:yes gene_type:complete
MVTTGATSWFGFKAGSGVNGVNVSDLTLYMDWPGFVSGTTNVPAVIQSTVPQVAGGTDAFGNLITAFTFKTTIVSGGTTTGNVWYSIWVPHSLLNNSTQVYADIGFNFNGNSTNFNVLTTDTTLRSYDIVYTGANWPNTTYRVFSNNGGYNQGSSGVVDTTDNFIRGGSLI